MRPIDYLRAARCPSTIQTGDFGLWKIERVPHVDVYRGMVYRSTLTILSHRTEATLHKGRGEVVMEDSARELRRHMPIWKEARGRVLVSGLGLGCVVRGLLRNPAVEQITVVELDQQIIDLIWPEFMPLAKCMVLHGDAMTYQWPPGMRFDYAWHDIWAEGEKEALLHGHMMLRYIDMVDNQGAWGMPRLWNKMIGGHFLRRGDA